MASTDVLVPELGASIAEATLRRWFKKPGDVVVLGEAIAEVETGMVTLDVEAPESGVLSDPVVSAGASVMPGAVLGQINHDWPARTQDPQEAATNAVHPSVAVFGIEEHPVYDEAGEFTRSAWQAIERAALSRDARRIAASLDQTLEFVKERCRAVSGRL